MHWTGQSGYSCLVLMKKAFILLLLLNSMLAIVFFLCLFFKILFSKLGTFPSIPVLLRNFTMIIAGIYPLLFSTYWYDHMCGGFFYLLDFFFWSVNMMNYMLIDFWMLNHPFIPRVNLSWSWCIIILCIYSWLIVLFKFSTSLLTFCQLILLIIVREGWGIVGNLAKS